MSGLPDPGGARPTIPGYRILGRLGQGGQGAVFLAERLGDGRKAAIKVLHVGVGEARRRFLREIALSRSFAHPNVVKILDGSLAHDHGDPWLAMEHLEGATLADVVGEGPLSEARVRAVAVDMARGLEYLHGRGLIHRDLKPANVFLEATGRAILLDFGLATGDELTRMTATRDIPGTFVAMAPEQLLCQPLSPATDVYQFGFTLYLALTGHAPFSVDELVRGISTGEWSEPAAPSGCSVELAALVLSCLQADAARRPADGAAVLALLEPEAIVDDGAPPPGRASVAHGAVTTCLLPGSAGRTRHVAAAGFLAAVVVVLSLLLLRPGERPSVRGPAVASSSVQAELLVACYGSATGPDPSAVTAVLRELDALTDSGVDAELRSALARAWREAARPLAEDDPARALVEAALYSREGSPAKAAEALLRALEGQRRLLKARGGALTPPQLSLEALLLGRWAALALDREDPGRTHRLFDESDRFVVTLPGFLAGAPEASTQRLMSLAARWVLWGRQGEAGVACREDAAPGLAAFALTLPAAELAAIPLWCAKACDAAAIACDPALLERCAQEALSRELARETATEALDAAHRLNELNHGVPAVASADVSYLVTVAGDALRCLRRAFWLTQALTWRRGAGHAAAIPLCSVSSAVVEIRLRGRLPDLAVAGKWGEGLEPDVLADGGVGAVLRVLEAMPGLAGDAEVAEAAGEWWVRSGYLARLAAPGRARFDAATADRPLLQGMLAVVACREAEKPVAAATADLLRRFLSMRAERALEGEGLTWACVVLQEGFRRGWFRISSAEQARYAEGQAERLIEALDASARASGAPAPVRRLWAMAVVVVANARLAGGGPVSGPDERSRKLGQCLGMVAASASAAGGDVALRELAAQVQAGRPAWPVVGNGP